MDQDFDDEDLRSLSERVLPLTSISYANKKKKTNNNNNNNNNNTSSHDNNQSIKSDKKLSSINRTVHDTLPKTGTIGDIIHLNNGVRKKFNGTSWRRMCSKPNCPYYNQKQGLCKPCLIQFEEQKILSTDDNSKNKDTILSEDNIPTKQNDPKEGDIITLSNDIRKRYDGEQYQRICADPSCAKTVDDSVDYQNGLCSYHYDKLHSKDLSESEFSTDTSVLSSPLSKRRCQDSSTEVPVLFNVQSSIAKISDRLSIASIPPSVDIGNPKKGDIIEMVNGTRKKFDGVIWRKICSIPGCLIASQRNNLCRKHVSISDNKSNNESSMEPSELKFTSSMSTSSNDEKRDDHSERQSKYHRDNNTDNNTNRKFVNNISSTRRKFSTSCLKKWLQQHRSHPYPSIEEKIELSEQSSMTFDQVTKWFNNSRAILRRDQIKLRHSSDSADNDDGDDEEDNNSDDEIIQENKEYSDTNDTISCEVHHSISLMSDIYSRSIGIQCNPSTANQVTLTDTSTMVNDEDELTSDRTIKILTPSEHVLKSINSMKLSNNQGFLIDNIETKIDGDTGNDHEIVVSSTCLDDDQLTRLQEFCSQFHIKLSNIVDKYTTHLITDEEGETLVCPLSKKVIQAIAYHLYIVTYRWIDACLETKKLINEKPFEIQGDLTLSSDHYGMQRSRQSVLPYNLPKTLLLENFSIMLKCDGCQGLMNNDELIEMIKLCGAKYTTDSHFSRFQAGLKRVVLCEKEYLINRKEIYEKCIHAGVYFVTPEWFLESLVQYCVQPFQEYEITP
ncbi:unnamed protein product [Adineta steineri]|uniref:Uncharacterized protein n=1 Tax=Adineta steineri TaxID=433720 RepID=A0A819F7N7_9BILA|nr:unnamed protein product [Adineta steineri]CAF3863614.1 unnamed protein product [Adineta steineri]